MLGGVRRSHALLASGGAVLLLLLLLTRLPPLPPAVPAPRAHHRPPPPPTLTSTANSVASSSASSSSPRAPPAVNVTSQPRAVPPPVPASPPASKDTKKNASEQVAYTKDLYEAGHLSPHPELCPRLGADIKVLVLVTSAPSHEPQRAAVRLTWGHYTLRRDVAMAFVLGRPADKYKAAVLKEDALYGDIIIGASMDSYSNLTLKSLSMLEWASTYCPRAEKLLKTDDDMFINVPRLLSFIASPARAKATKTIWGRIMKKGLPRRIPKSKYYLSKIQYKPKILPDFASGPAYLMTNDSIRPLLEAAPEEPYVRLEDVFVTGILANKVGIRRLLASEFYNKKVSPHPCSVQRGISIHMVQFHEQFDFWRKLLDGKTKCS